MLHCNPDTSRICDRDGHVHGKFHFANSTREFLASVSRERIRKNYRINSLAIESNRVRRNVQTNTVFKREIIRRRENSPRVLQLLSFVSLCIQFEAICKEEEEKKTEEIAIRARAKM